MDRSAPSAEPEQDAREQTEVGSFVLRNIREFHEHREQHKRNLTTYERTANWIAEYCSRPETVILNAAFFCVWIAFATAGCQTSTQRYNGTSEPTESQGQKDLVVSDVATERQSSLDMVSIVGIVTNKGKDEYDYVLITFNVYDLEGNQTGTASDMISNLEARGRWKFEAMIPGASHGSYKLKEVTGMVKQPLN